MCCVSGKLGAQTLHCTACDVRSLAGSRAAVHEERTCRLTSPLMCGGSSVRRLRPRARRMSADSLPTAAGSCCSALPVRSSCRSAASCPIEAGSSSSPACAARRLVSWLQAASDDRSAASRAACWMSRSRSPMHNEALELVLTADVLIMATATADMMGLPACYPLQRRSVAERALPG
jgi:hypothetical protein